MPSGFKVGLNAGPSPAVRTRNGEPFRVGETVSHEIGHLLEQRKKAI
jgi:hypothetical protein